MPNRGDAYSTLIKGLPESEATILNVAHDLFGERKFAEGSDFIDRAVNTFSSHALVVVQAKFWKATGRAQDAIGILVTILRENDSNTDVLLGLVGCLIECGEYERARKMLNRAKTLNAPAMTVDSLDLQLQALEGHTGKISSEVVEKRHTMMGLPNYLVSDPISDTGAQVALSVDEDQTIESGTFADLAAYLSDADNEETINTQLPVGILGDQNFDSVLDSMGVSIPTKPFKKNETASPSDPTVGLRVDIQGSPYSPTASGLFTSAPRFENNLPNANENESGNNDFGPNAAPDEKTEFLVLQDPPTDPHQDQTNIVVLSDDQAAPHDATSHIIIKDGKPHQLDDAPTGNLVRSPESAPTGKILRNNMQNVIDELDNEATQHIVLEESFPAADPVFSAVPAHDPAPTLPPAPQYNNAPPQYPIGQPVVQSPQPPAARSMQSDDIPFPSGLSSGEIPKFVGNPMAVQPVPQPQRSTARPKPKKKTSAQTIKKWPIIIGVMAIFLFFSIFALLAFAGYSRTKVLNENFAEVQTALSLDDYPGYLLAKKKLEKGLQQSSFLGTSGDRVIQSVMPFSSFRSGEPEVKHLASLALVDAILEARFESLDSQNAELSLKNAKARAPDHPAVWVAEILRTYASGRPHDAISFSEKAKTKFPKSTLVDELRVLLFMSLGQHKKAYEAGASLRKKEPAAVREKYYAALSLPPEDRDAMQIFSDLLDTNPNHVDAIIDRSLLLRDGASELKRAETELSGLPREASQYQAARASNALGYLLLAKQDKAAAEENFRTAIRKMPKRNELYQPLLDFYFTEGRYADAKESIDQVGELREISTQLSLRKTELLILSSQYQAALGELDRTQFTNPKKDWLRGLAIYHQYNYEKALTQFEKANDKNAEYPRMAAFREMTRVFIKNKTKEDALQQLTQLKAEYPDDPFVKFALAKIRIQDGIRTKSLAKRKEQFASARKELVNSVKLKKYPMFYFELCDLYRLELDFDKAKANCAKGKKIAGDYLPGQLTSAKLKIDAGAFEDANNILKALRKSNPDDAEIGLLSVRVALGRRHLKTARTELNKWLGKPQTDPFELFLLDGKIRFMTKAYGQAVGFFERAYKLNKTDPEASIFYAHALTRLGRTREALPLLRDAKRHPIWAGQAFIVEGEAQRRRGKADLAIAALDKARKFFRKKRPKGETYSILFTERALAQKAKFGWAHPNVATEFNLARRNGDLDEPYFNLNYALFYLNQKSPNEKEARKAFQRVLKSEPGNCRAINNLVQLYKKRGSKKKLKRYIQSQKKFCKR